jgi:cytochrome c-type biogenesis protein CcmE
VIALSVAAALAVFILYTAVVGGATTQLSPSQLAGHTNHVALVGTVVGPVTGDAHAAGLRFRVKDVTGSSKVLVPVDYHGSVPDLFKVGRHIVLTGQLHGATFVGDRDSLITKCPSKYAPAKTSTSG